MYTKSLISVSTLLLVFGTGAAVAAGTNTLTVSASVVGVCQFSTTSSTLAFGNLDPSSTSDATATGSVAYWCTKGTVASTAAGNGANYDATNSIRRMKNGSDYIPYSLNVTGGTGTGAGKGSTALSLSLGGTIINGDFINASAGAYADTVTLTITP
jgi:spore coat protein U-like protein